MLEGVVCPFVQPLLDPHMSGPSRFPSNRCRVCGSKSSEVLEGSGPMVLKGLGSQVPDRL